MSLDNHPDKLRELMSAHIETTAESSTPLTVLIRNSARREVNHYFQEDDHPYLRNLVERVAKGVVDHHLNNNAPNLLHQQIQPPAPDTSTPLDDAERYIPPVQESPSQRLHPTFDAA